LLVLDGTRHLETNEWELFDLLPKEKTIALWNKSDHPSYSACQTPFTYALHISAKEKRGLEELKNIIGQFIWQQGVPPKEELFITTLRHKEALSEAIGSLHALIQGLAQGLSPEFLTNDLRDALTGLGRMIGTNISEEILTSIFSQFCIGK
jgi:tRNA modification GTPase